MIDIPASEVIKKIVSQTELSEEEVKKRINEKLTQLSGLISENGAAHIVANDLGVQVYKTEGIIKLSELNTGAKNITINAKVLQKYEVRTFNKNDREGKVGSMLIGDDSGKTRLVFWNDQVDIFEKLSEGDIIRVINPLIKDNSGRLEIHFNDRSELKINPEGVSIIIHDKKRALKYIKDLEGNETNIELLGTIVHVFETRFFNVCPECNKRVSGENQCPVHGIVEPITNYVTSCFLDDGTGNLRVTFWKSQTQKLFGLSNDEILKWEKDPSLAEPHKHKLLGEIIKVVGNAKKNEQFNRMDFTANLIFKDIDPEKELANLDEKNNVADNAKDDMKVDDKVDVKNNDENEEKDVEEETIIGTKKEMKEEAPEDLKEEENEESTVNIKEESKNDDKQEDDKGIDIVVNKNSAIKEEVISIDDLEDL